MRVARQALLVLTLVLTAALGMVSEARAADCPAGCSGRGVCLDDGVCACEPGFAGLDCSAEAPLPCPAECSGRGVCQLGKCFCDSGWSGDACEVSPRCPGDCSGQGVCVAGVCACTPGFEGLDCATPVASCPSDCSGHGVCGRGVCFCDPGYEGAACERAPACPSDCGGRGVCQYGKCFCEPGWTGDDCGTASALCPRDCSGRGACQYGKCFCEPGFSGDACETVTGTCPRDCSGRGVCQYGKCFCEPDRGGEDCGTDLLACPADCNGRGQCLFGQCFCLPGYAGKACGVAAADVLLGKAEGLRVFWVPTAGALRIERDEPDANGAPGSTAQEVPLPRLLTDDAEFLASTVARFPTRVDLTTATSARDVVLTGRWGNGARCTKYGQCMIFALQVPPPGGDGPATVPGGFPERFDGTAERLVRGDVCGTGAVAGRGGGRTGRQGGHMTVLEDYGLVRPPAYSPSGLAPHGARLRAALAATPGFLASGATAAVLAFEGTDGGVSLDPTTGQPLWTPGQVVPVEVWTSWPVDADTATLPAEAACGTILLARSGTDRSVVQMRAVGGCAMGLDASTRYGGVVWAGSVDRDPDVATGVGNGLATALGLGTLGMDRDLLVVGTRPANAAQRADIGSGFRWISADRTSSLGGDSPAAAGAGITATAESSRGLASVAAAFEGAVRAASELRSLVVLDETDCRLLVADDLAPAPALRAFDACGGAGGEAALPEDFLAVSDLAGGHFVDDWQGETAFLKAIGTFEPEASDACVPSLPICEAAEATCGKARLGVVPVRVTLGVRGEAGVEFTLGVRTAPPTPEPTAETLSRLATARASADVYADAAAATGALAAPLGTAREAWLSLADVAFSRVGGAGRVRVTAWGSGSWSGSGSTALSGAPTDGGFDPEALCLAKDPLGGCGGAGLLPRAIVIRTMEMGTNPSSKLWTTSESVGLAWRDRRDLSRAAACLVPVDPAAPTGEAVTLGALFGQVRAGLGTCGELEAVDPDTWAATASALGDPPTTTVVRFDGRIRYRDDSQLLASSGPRRGSAVRFESAGRGGLLPAEGALPALFEALDADVPLARAGGFDLRAVPYRGEDVRAGGDEPGIHLVVEGPTSREDGTRALLAGLVLSALDTRGDIAGAELALAFDTAGLLVEPVVRLAPTHDLAAACPLPGCSVDVLLPPVASLGGSAPRLRPLVDAADAFWRDRGDFPWARVRRLVRKSPAAPVPLAVGDAALAALAEPFLPVVLAAGGSLLVRVPVQDFELTPTCSPRQACPVYRGEVAALARHDAAGFERLTAATLWSPDGTSRETRVNALSGDVRKDQEMLAALDGNPALRVAQVTVTTEPTTLAALLAESVGDAACQASASLLSAPLGGGRTAAPERWVGASRATVFGAEKPDLLPAGATVFLRTKTGGDFNRALQHCGWTRD